MRYMFKFSVGGLSRMVEVQANPGDSAEALAKAAVDEACQLLGDKPYWCDIAHFKDKSGCWVSTDHRRPT